MTTRPDQPGHPGDPHVPWPVRLFAVVLVLPVRLVWELLTAAGRALVDHVLSPAARLLAWLLDHLILRPLAFLGHYLIAVPFSWLWRRVLAHPLGFLWHYLVVVPLTWLGRTLMALARATAPVWTAIGRAIRDWLLIPLLKLLAGIYLYVLRPGWLGAGWVLRLIHRWTLRPLGLATRWAWRHTAVPVGRTITAAGRWVNTALLRPAAATVRSILVGRT